MNQHPMRRAIFSLALAAALSACAPANDSFTDESNKDDQQQDITAAMAALPSVEVVRSTYDGVPTLLRGELGKAVPPAIADPANADGALRPVMARVLAPFRLKTQNVTFKQHRDDEKGNRHYRYKQTVNGLDVIGGDLVVHVDASGSVYSVNGTARGDFPSALGSKDIGASAALARVSADKRFGRNAATAPRAVYLLTPNGGMHKAYETVVAGERGRDPFRDRVYVDVDTGEIVAVHPTIYFAESRKVYSANNGSTIPGTLKRSEGGAATGDQSVDAAYDGTGATYEAYKAFWNRDSYNNAGATLISTVHYSTNYCNAYWNGTQMVYGDGDSTQGCAPLALAQDVTAHELTHAVTENESNLTYSGESGGLNEAMSDIFGEFVEAYVDGGKTGTLAVSANTWLVGEKVLPPALRYMNDPAKDGSSLDYWTSSAGNVDVHYSSGIANLAFYLMSQGGTHPRGKSTVSVTGIGMTKAIKVFYSANTNYLTSSSNFLAARDACLTAAGALGLTQAEKDGVQNAWAAVGVGAAVGGGGGGGGGTGDVTLTSGVAKTSLSGATGAQAFYVIAVPAGQTSLTVTMSGGTGDADMYVQSGSHPTLTTYACRPYVSGNAETCTFTNPAAANWYVMLNGYTAYSGVSLTATYAVATDTTPALTNGVAVTGLAGAASSLKYYKLTVPAGQAKVVFTMSGGTGDADLYVKKGVKPTTTAYDCRPYLTGNAETCTVTAPAAGDYYVMVRGYSAYSGVSLKGQYP
jgi:vibriolysin